MKKLFILVATIMCSVAIVGAKEMSSNNSINEMTISAPGVKVPTGIFWNGSNFIKVESSWIRIYINRQSKEYSFRAEMDPHGNYALVFGNGQSITIYSNGRTLYYNGTTYSKK